MHRFNQSVRPSSSCFSSVSQSRRRFFVLWLAMLLILSASAALRADSRLNINTASAMELADQLPGIGPVKAEAIVAYREANGTFKRVDDIVNVSGIGPATLTKLRPFITVGEIQSSGNELPAVSSSGTVPIAALTQQQMELMARAATRAAIQLAVEDARGQPARDSSSEPGRP